MNHSLAAIPKTKKGHSNQVSSIFIFHLLEC